MCCRSGHAARFATQSFSTVPCDASHPQRNTEKPCAEEEREQATMGERLESCALARLPGPNLGVGSHLERMVHQKTAYFQKLPEKVRLPA